MLHKIITTFTKINFNFMTKTFLQNILSSALGFIIGFTLLICSIFILLIGTALISSLFSNESEIEANSVLKITFYKIITKDKKSQKFHNNLHTITMFSSLGFILRWGCMVHGKSIILILLLQISKLYKIVILF